MPAPALLVICFFLGPVPVATGPFFFISSSSTPLFCTTFDSGWCRWPVLVTTHRTIVFLCIVNHFAGGTSPVLFWCNAFNGNGLNSALSSAHVTLAFLRSIYRTAAVALPRCIFCIVQVMTCQWVHTLDRRPFPHTSYPPQVSSH